MVRRVGTKDRVDARDQGAAHDQLAGLTGRLFGADIEDALLSVLFEIDEITQATFSSITLDTLLKTIYWRGQK